MAVVRVGTLRRVDLKQALPVGVGFIAGIAFVVACPAPVQLSPSTTHAEPESWEPAEAAVRQPSGCLRWEVQMEQAFAMGPRSGPIEPGWEPFAVTDLAVVTRRCVASAPGV